jgi:hypothetical protein
VLEPIFELPFIVDSYACRMGKRCALRSARPEYRTRAGARSPFWEWTLRTALRAARRSLFDEALGLLERGAGVAAQVLLDEIANTEGINSNRSPSIINASKAVLDGAFLAAVKEELAELRAELTSLKAQQQKVPPVPLPVQGPPVQGG